MDVLDILGLKVVLRGQMVTLKLSLVNGFRITRKDGLPLVVYGMNTSISSYYQNIPSVTT
jgi:hypothetical protein